MKAPPTPIHTQSQHEALIDRVLEESAARCAWALAHPQRYRERPITLTHTHTDTHTGGCWSTFGLKDILTHGHTHLHTHRETDR